MGRLGGYDVFLHAIPQIEIHLELLRLCFTIALGILFNLELVDETWLSGLMRLAEKMFNHGQQFCLVGHHLKTQSDGFKESRFLSSGTVFAISVCDYVWLG